MITAWKLDVKKMIYFKFSKVVVSAMAESTFNKRKIKAIHDGLGGPSYGTIAVYLPSRTSEPLSKSIPQQLNWI